MAQAPGCKPQESQKGILPLTLGPAHHAVRTEVTSLALGGHQMGTQQLQTRFLFTDIASVNKCEQT